MNSEKTLYLECYAGISGDMTVAALLDLGASQEVLQKAIASLPIDGYEIQISRVMKSGIDACDFNVILDSAHENHDHDMEYLHGHNQEEEHNHTHEETHSHEELHNHGEHTHNNHGASHHHEHRGLKEVEEIIQKGNLTDHARELALSIFHILAQAEAKAHNVSIEEVHFHEVGAVDSIIDIVSAAVCFDNLHITQVIVPGLYEGRGTIRCQHGILPIPVPATVAIMEAHHLPVSFMDAEGEFVTPTGAAIVAAVMTGTSLPQSFTIEKTGIGAGKRAYERPSMLRAMLIQKQEEKQEETDFIYKLESNIDDCSGEMLGYAMEKLFAAGARDVHYIPVYMKKNRPGYLLSVICDRENMEQLEQIIFHETTTIGIRRSRMERSVLKRENMQISCEYGVAQVKVCTLQDEKRYYPEYDSVVAICNKTGKSYQEIYHFITEMCQRI